MRSLRTALPSTRGLVIVAFLVVAPLGVATARQLAPISSSPATGHAQVVTQGIAELPAEPLIWRVVERTAQPRWEAKAGKRVLGFVLASDEPVLLTNVTADGSTVDVARLGDGEAYLVLDGTRQLRASLSDQPVSYLSLELVPATDADKVGNGTVLYTSPAFTPPPGARDVDLVRNVLRLRETATVPDTGQSVYILATDGAIDILPATGEPTRLQQGESGIFTGPLDITAVQPASARGGQIAASNLTAAMLQDVDTTAGYVVAVIGEEIPPVQTPTPPPSPTPIPTDAPLPTETAVEQPTVTATEEPTEAPPAEPTPTEGPADTDGDGLEDVWEKEYGGDPNNPDTDGDGLLDGEERYVYGTSVNNPDTDQDALQDGAEVEKYGTDPTNPDTDGDRIPDGREVAAGSDPLDPKDPPTRIAAGRMPV